MLSSRHRRRPYTDHSRHRSLLSPISGSSVPAIIHNLPKKKKKTLFGILQPLAASWRDHLHSQGIRSAAEERCYEAILHGFSVPRHKKNDQKECRFRSNETRTVDRQMLMMTCRSRETSRQGTQIARRNSDEDERKGRVLCGARVPRLGIPWR